jgi:glycosyltransferase involved in cell wall biosynthesis
MTLLVHVATVPDSLVFLRGQPAFMREKGIETVVVTSPGPMLEAFGAQEGVRTIGIPMRRAIAPLADARALRALVMHLARLRPDIVHAHTPKGGLLGTTAAFLAGVPKRIYHMRGLRFAAMPRGPERALLVTAERASCALATRVLCVSHSLRDAAIAERIAPAHRLVVLGAGSGQGVDATHRFDPASQSAADRARTRLELGIPPSAPVIGFVGRLVRDKGIAELASAWLEIRERIPTAHLVIVGAFEEEDPVDPKWRLRLERDDRVRFTGFRDDTERFYAVFDVLALPSYREGFPNVPLEAAAMEVPVVTTAVPGCVDAVVDGRTGTIVPARDAGALRDALLRYLRSPDLRRAHGIAARARALRDFDRRAVWSALREEYLSRPGPRSASGRRAAESELRCGGGSAA